MSVDLRNYVQVNINYHEAKPLNRTRDTAVLFTVNTAADAPQARLNTHTPKGGSKAVNYFVSVADYQYAIAQYNATIDPEAPDAETPIDENVLLKYVKCFFNNGGVKLRIIGGFEENTSAGAPALDDQIQAWILAQCVALEAEYIVITSDCSEANLEAVARSSASINVIPNGINSANTVEALTGYKEKMFIASTNNSSLEIESPDQIPNFVIKFGPAGIEMACAAYLTQVNINDSRTIQDYCYTIEDVSMFTGAVQDNNDTVVELAGKYFNVDTTLVNNVRNVTGDTICGFDLMNYYVRIILTQTLTNRIINTLVTKIKFDRSGINKVVNAITQELNLYKSSGYLSSEFIWTDDDLYYSFNGQDYLVCARNTPLKMGYKFIILPISSLTQEQKDSHVFPPVYVLIADSMSIRQIVINGDAY